MGHSKNRQPIETIMEMAKQAFPEREFVECKEIDSGFFNAIYKITFSDDFQSILKIETDDRSCLMKNEVEMMEAEVSALSLLKDKLTVKVPEVYYFDGSRKICSGKYFFMEFLEGQRYSDIKDTLPKETKEKIDYKIGKLVKEIAEIQNPVYKTLGGSETFETLFDFTSFLLGNVVSDAESKKMDFFISKEELFELLEKDRRCFDCNVTPSLVHYDLWEGNIFIQNDEITGIIDLERALFGDPLMEDRFRLQKYTLSFFDGYGQSQFNYKETRRLLWYDIILYLSMMLEGSFRGYEDSSIYDYSSPLLQQAITMLKIQPF
ncbi:phosphotransferase family protein [Treponema sp.]|uniref:phosphotransferase family protein n=1 Tax=Treponema sp. TaxID=166 RepID=UPI00298DD7F9|nr:phosphotransferase [Treponema sp.]MCQ2241663.1 phosphotransferase [Treponema sp.]